MTIDSIPSPRIKTQLDALSNPLEKMMVLLGEFYENKNAIEALAIKHQLVADFLVPLEDFSPTRINAILQKLEKRKASPEVINTIKEFAGNIIDIYTVLLEHADIPEQKAIYQKRFDFYKIVKSKEPPSLLSSFSYDLKVIATKMEQAVQNNPSPHIKTSWTTTAEELGLVADKYPQEMLPKVNMAVDVMTNPETTAAEIIKGPLLKKLRDIQTKLEQQVWRKH